MYICIAGQNKCAVEAVKFLLSIKVPKKKILILVNSDDNGEDSWKPSLKKYSKKKKLRLVSLSNLYKIKNLIFFSLEYEKIINVKKFKSKNLYNLHFSLLPKYRGCHTNFMQIYNGEKFSGVTLHKIDKGIDTGEILDQVKFKINVNDTAFDNFQKLMKYSILLFKKNYNKIINNKFKTKKQILTNGSYYSRSSVDYSKLNKIVLNKFTLKNHNKIRSLIFPPYQYPVVNGVEIKKSLYKNKKIYLVETSADKIK